VDAFPGGLCVLGGKAPSISPSAPLVPPATNVHAAFLIGAAAPKIADQLQGAVPLVAAKTIDAAVAHAYANAMPGDTVLLAPACASFDQFQSYEHRGQFFKQIVNQLQAKD
jgi:UDP-N-acetylmuramoylalanine--D-glutamate ligase